MLSKRKKVSSDIDEHLPTSKRFKSFQANNLGRIWLLSNYEFKSGMVTAASDIASLAKKEKQMVTNPSLIGRLINEIWGDKVQRRNRGPRKLRKNVYLNLSRRAIHCNTNNCNPSPSFNPIQFNELKSVQLPPGWTFVENTPDNVSFVRIEHWEFREARGSVEVSCKNVKREDKVSEVQWTSIRSHGCECKTDLPIVNGLGLSEQVMLILEYVDRSSLCRGFSMKEGESTNSIAPTICGTYRKSATDTLEIRAFSQDCRLFSRPGSRCDACYGMASVLIKKKARKLASSAVHPQCNNRYLSKEELVEKLKAQQQRRKMTEQREKYWKGKFKSESLEMEEEDHKDMCSLFDSCIKEKNDVPEDMRCLWEHQRKKNATTSKKGNRWHPKMMRLCLDLYCKNPSVLDPLKKFITLPSNRAIRLNKNKVEQVTGWNDSELKSCTEEARKHKLKGKDYYGGFVIDEVKIQENLEIMTSQNGKHRLVGFVDLAKAQDPVSEITENKEQELTTHVLQFFFLSDCGFRFPIAQFPSGTRTPSDLYLIFWEGVVKMLEEGFTVYWCVLEGTSVNREFIKIHFQDMDPVENMFMTKNVNTFEPMIFVMDPKHNIKKLRNNIEKSNLSGKPRCLQIGGKTIVWKQFKDAYNWDHVNHSLPLHERLTKPHFALDSSSKMCSRLAEDVLDQKMLSLIKKYKKIKRKDGLSLDAVLDLLSHSSNLVKIFNDKKPISSVTDKRLVQLNSFHHFLMSWREETADNDCHFLSPKLWFDLQSMFLGFLVLVTYKLNKFPKSGIKPAIVNRDCAENPFCLE